MNDELTKCYELLGLSPGASPEELKVAYRDLAKVWHPDRFLHDPRLQEKAQEKLKEINEAYDQLRSGKANRQTPPAASTNDRRTPPTSEHFNQYAKTSAQTGSVAVAQKIRWQFVLAPIVIFAVVFLATYRSLLRPGQQEDQSQVSAIEQPDSRDATSATELPNVTDRSKAKSQREEVNASTSQPSAADLRPMPTVTVEIDPYTRMIARSDCPVKSTMTYASGNEPHQLCNAVHAAVAKDSRIKSVAKRLASPDKWFGDGAKPDAAKKQDPKSP